MEEKTKSKPPYPSTGQADEILDIFRRVSPKKIDAENNVKEEIASKLRLVGDERDKFIAELIKSAYKEILDGVNLQQARREDLINFFIHNYNYGVAPAKSASI